MHYNTHISHRLLFVQLQYLLGFGEVRYYLVVVGHRLEIIINHRLESVAAVDAIF